MIAKEEEVYLVREGDAVLAEVWPVGGKKASVKRRRSSGGSSLKRKESTAEGEAEDADKSKETLDKVKEEQEQEKEKMDAEDKERKEKITSFSTGPESIPTHWKQTVFLLKEPIGVEEGTFSLIPCLLRRVSFTWY